MVDLAYRAYAHSFKLDPIIRSLLDQDFYKFLMGQLICRNHPDLDVTFALTNRTRTIHLSRFFDIQELREQLDHARTLRFQNNELIWLQGNTFYGKLGMFWPEYIQFLREFQLPEYELRQVPSGEYDLRFPGKYSHTTMWEVPALSIINELRYRAIMRSMSQFELDVMYSRAKAKLWNKLQRLRLLDDLNLTDFGTRRRHSHLFQEWAILAAKDALGAAFTGTSNAFFALKHALEAKGTNAHERPTVAAALANTDEELRQSEYDVLTEWSDAYDGALRILLPDTYGTTQFLQNAPDWVADWTGARIDSKDPFIGTEELIQWWQERGRDPTSKLVLATDGMDVDPIIDLHMQFHKRTRIGFGWGSLLTNDFRDCHPYDPHVLDPVSIVIKAISVNGRPGVKLSDNYEKAIGDPDEIVRYRRCFGTAGVANIPVLV